MADGVSTTGIKTRVCPDVAVVAGCCGWRLWLWLWRLWLLVLAGLSWFWSALVGFQLVGCGRSSRGCGQLARPWPVE